MALLVYQNIRLGHNTDVTKAEVDEATNNIEAAVQLAMEKGVWGPVHFLQQTTRPTLIDRFDPNSIMLPGSEFSWGSREVIEWREDWKAYIDNTDYPAVRISLDRSGPSASDLEMVKLLWSEGDEEDLQQEAEEEEEEDEEDWDDCSTVAYRGRIESDVDR
ncbi:uncharacterized protein N7459_001032 [Penicillium hispanicum]|uniref:uncharacterized protein n=1 Tax=Penicillium hispanicum TaxID=1080232 RepID=UPI0025424995|nr:uncharacterized protein N7459_001032 [Penicillium hispanicum]KAJ5594824.1 hypothetical protein N7459_001032 [Penicillium hispanicum]